MKHSKNRLEASHYSCTGPERLFYPKLILKSIEQSVFFSEKSVALLPFICRIGLRFGNPLGDSLSLSFTILGPLVHSFFYKLKDKKHEFVYI